VRLVLIVLKYGGNAMAAADAPDPLLDDIAERVRLGDGVLLVHGGGPHIDAALARQGVVTQRIDGLRITDAATLAVTESVLCGTVNKALVRALARRGIVAAGVSGEDAGTLIARAMAPRSGVSLGFVGEIETVRVGMLRALLAARIVPVVAPLGITADGSQALNVNADSSAGAIAGALAADAYVIVTNVERVRRVAHDPVTGIASLRISEARAYLADGTFDGGMVPKMESALDALARGAHSAVICGSGPRALTRALAGEGTTILPGFR
jgi:acetylglutamate kinase